MARIYLCLVWHMHQPCYKDLVTGEYKLPWTRLHALKDYYGMVRILELFPRVRQTFNLVPSLIAQIEEYASGEAADPFQSCALKPAEDLTESEQAFALHYLFQANLTRMIRRYPRYGELYDAWQAADRNPRRARQFFTPRAFRDLQVLSQLAWFDEEYLDHDEGVRELAAKARDYTLDDQAWVGRKQLEILNKVLPVYRDFAARGRIEVSTTPFYHPILPLITDSNIAGTAHPYVPLPSRFRYPEDARRQLERARACYRSQFGRDPDGLWPSEGSVSDEALALAADTGFRWAATDNGVLTRTLNRLADVELTYRPYVWRQDGRELRLIFRDHYLSDLIGFVYARMGAVEAATHFLDRIRENCDGILAAGSDALVPVILDGENAWEYYEKNGRPFLAELYRLISESSDLEAVTVSEALERVRPEPLDHIFPGSWINANFDIWIGAEEDNRAWEYLLRARQTYDLVANSPDGASIPAAALELALEELLIAEGSDWCWWYGPEHYSINRVEFDHLFRAHLANVYRALQVTPPDELSRPIVRLELAAFHQPPGAPVRAVVDGDITSYFEWMGAGLYRIDSRSGAMHGQRFLIRELHYGSDGEHLFLRLDFEEQALAADGVEARFHLQSVKLTVRFRDGAAYLDPAPCPAAIAFARILELSVPLSSLGVAAGYPVRLQVSLWRGGLPVDALPHEGWLEISTAEPRDWPA